MKISIYVLKHPETGDIRYVGQTNDPKRRLSRHINNSQRLFSDKRHISNWIRSLSSAPVMDIVEVCDYSQRNEKEQHWIAHYTSKGYNLCNSSKGGAGAGVGNTNCVGRLLSDQTKQRISTANKGRKVSHGKGGVPGKAIYQYDKHGNPLNSFKSILNASKTLGICRRTIKNSLNNKPKARTRCQYKFSYT